MKNKQKKILVILFVLLVITIIYYINIQFGIKIPCLFHRFTGWYCPGCGITRCLIAIVDLDFYQAFRYNMLGFILLPFLLIYGIYKLWIWWFDKTDNFTKRIPNIVWYIMIIVLIIYGIMRNINQFSWMSPIDI